MMVCRFYKKKRTKLQLFFGMCKEMVEKYDFLKQKYGIFDAYKNN
jgi:hypothetical protein